MTSSEAVRTSAQQRFGDALESLCTHVVAVASSFAVATACVRDTLSPSPHDADDATRRHDDSAAKNSSSSSSTSASEVVARAAVQLQHGVDGCTRTLHDCLDDLRATTRAMAAVMQSCPDEMPRLLVNLFGALTRQLGTYYRDVGVVFAACEAALDESRRHGAMSGGAKARTAATPTTLPTSSHEQPQQQPAATTTTTTRTPTSYALPAVLPAAPSPSQQQQQPQHDATSKSPRERHARVTPTTAVTSPASSSSQLLHEPTFVRVAATTTIEDALGAAAVTSRPAVFAPVALLRARAPVADYFVRLRRAGSLGDLLARAYVNVDEDAFADVVCEVLATDCVELGPFESAAGGDVVLPRLRKHNNNDDDDDDDDDDVDVSALPACAWRTCSNEEQTRLLYTSYALVREAPSYTASVLVHDVVHTNDVDDHDRHGGRHLTRTDSSSGAADARVEVLHVITCVPPAGETAAAPYAHVRAYTLLPAAAAATTSPRRFRHDDDDDNMAADARRPYGRSDDMRRGSGGGGGAAQLSEALQAPSRAAALVSLTRSLYTRVGFAGVDESDVRAYMQQQQQQQTRDVTASDAAASAAVALQQQTAAASASRRARRADKTRSKGSGGASNNNNNRDGAAGGDATATATPATTTTTAAVASSGESVLAQLPHYRASTPRDATVTFRPDVQLASLDEPADGDGATGAFASVNASVVGGLQSLTMSDVAKGAMRGGLEVLKAPLTVGRAVSGAVLDATGVTDAMRSNMANAFRRAFPALADETMIDSFGCAWQDGALPKQGSLFVTPHWLCFQSSIAAAQFAIEYDEIKDVKKAKVAKLFDTALELHTHVGDTYVLVNFLQRDQAYTTVMQQWLK